MGSIPLTKSPKNTDQGSPIADSLEQKLQCKLNRPRVVGRRDRAEVTGAEFSADATIQSVTDPLMVVPYIEEFGTELDVGAAILVEWKVLK